MASSTARLRRVLLRRPPADCSHWRALGWCSEPDPVALAEELDTLETLVYRADELSKGEGGPTCLTLPLLRG